MVVMVPSRNSDSLSTDDIEHYLKTIVVIKQTINTRQQINKLEGNIEESL